MSIGTIGRWVAITIAVSSLACGSSPHRPVDLGRSGEPASAEPGRDGVPAPEQSGRGDGAASVEPGRGEGAAAGGAGRRAAAVSTADSGRGGTAGDPEPAALAGMLAAHNRDRARHCAPPLVWSRDVARVAQAWADRLAAAGCAFEHSGTRQYGENLAMGTAGVMDPAAVVDMWYGEVAAYDFRRAEFGMESGHFTQVVWVGSRRLGCGTSRCKGMDIWVCNYDPPGNFEGQFRENVRPTTCSR